MLPLVRCGLAFVSTVGIIGCAFSKVSRPLSGSSSQNSSSTPSQSSILAVKGMIGFPAYSPDGCVLTFATGEVRQVGRDLIAQPGSVRLEQCRDARRTVPTNPKPVDVTA